MKKNIKIIILTAILGLAFSLTACNFSVNNAEKKSKKKTSPAAPTNTPVNTPSGDLPEKELQPDEIPLTLLAITKGKIILSGRNSFETVQIQKNDGLIEQATDNISVQAGDKIRFYAKNYKYSQNGTNNLTIDSSADCYVYGNVMSLIYFTDFAGKTEITENYVLQKLFLNNTHIKNNENLELILPATSLSDSCYKKMFYGCSGITKAPELPAQTLKKECYSYMFYNCTNLNSIKCLATNISATDSTQNWISNVSGTGNFTSSPNNSIWRTKDKESGIPEGWISDPPFEVVNAKELPLTLEAAEAGNITLTNRTEFKNLKYSKNDGEKTTAEATIEVNAGDRVSFFAEGPSNEDENYLTINCSSDCYVYGNIMSLIDPDDFSTKTQLSLKRSFTRLFFENSHIKNCSIDLLLPATTLTDFCYYSMFSRCSGLTRVAELPAESLAVSCYAYMYTQCTGLTKAQESLPATTLKDSCYAYMFLDCDKLVSAPELPATTLAEFCYGKMFTHCTNLSRVTKELPATTLTEECYSGMFTNCKSLTSAPQIKATTVASSSCYQMFFGCSSLITAPDLLAKNTEKECYREMFDACSNLIEAPDLVAETLKKDCYKNMFSGCKKLCIIKCLAKSGETSLQGLCDGLGNTYGLLVCVDTNNFTDIPSNWTKVKEIPLTLEVIQDGTITINNKNGDADIFTNLKYIKNYNSRTSVTSTDNSSITVKAGDIICFFAEGKTTQKAYLTIDCTSDCYVYGDIMSLDNYSETISYTNSTYGEFTRLFYNNIHIKNHPSKKIILSPKTLTKACYREMFCGCTGLTSAPELPATTLDERCYENMFKGCTGLTSAPELPVTTLKNQCYYGMFNGCKGLTSAPELPATTLTYACYEYMFQGCSGLTSAPELPATTLTKTCYGYMFDGCTSLTSAPELPATTLDERCYENMFKGCKGLTSAPELPATKLKPSCYESMFENCTALKNAPELNANTLVTCCYRYMFRGCSSLNYIKCLATNASSTTISEPLFDWTKNVSSTGTFVKAQGATWPTGPNGIPNGWTVVEAQ